MRRVAPVVAAIMVAPLTFVQSPNAVALLCEAGIWVGPSLAGIAQWILCLAERL